eukprot:scaffold314591_cov36-Tisochrysis_lutea.AAC.1
MCRYWPRPIRVGALRPRLADDAPRSHIDKGPNHIANHLVERPLKQHIHPCISSPFIDDVHLRYPPHSASAGDVVWEGRAARRVGKGAKVVLAFENCCRLGHHVQVKRQVECMIAVQPLHRPVGVELAGCPVGCVPLPALRVSLVGPLDVADCNVGREKA